MLERVRQAGPLLVVLVGAAACHGQQEASGGGGSDRGRTDDGGSDRAAAAGDAPAGATGDGGIACGGDWRVLYASAPQELPPGRDDLRWKDGTLFVGHSSTDYAWIFSLPDQGGSKNLLYEGHARAFWQEDDRLLYAQDYDLYDMPIAGGPPRHVLHYGDMFYDPLGGGSLTNHTLDRGAIYWIMFQSKPGDELSIWRGPRDGSGDSILEWIPSAETSGRAGMWMTQTPDALVVSLAAGASGPYAATIAKTGGDLQPLPVFGGSSNLLNLSSDGALLWARQATSSDDAGAHASRLELGLGHLDGSDVQPFPTGVPSNAGALAAWPGSDGRWYLAASEPDTAGGAPTAPLLSVWSIAADGTASRLACSRSRDSVSAGVVVSGALVLALAQPSGGWSLVRIDDPPAPAGGDGGAASVDGGIGDVSGGSGDAGAPPECGFAMSNPATSGLPNPATYDVSVPGVVVDQVTGLMWQATLSGQAAPPGCTADASGVLSCPQRYAAAACAASTLAGHADWRLPAVTELASLIDFTVASPPAPAIDAVRFPGTPRDLFWTSTRLGDHPDFGWLVGFDEGLNATRFIDEPHLVRCVRASGAPPPRCYPAGARFQVSDDLVLDAATGLTWQGAMGPGGLNFAQAGAYCDGMGGGLRLPSPRELLTLVDFTRSYTTAPTIDRTAFPGPIGEWFWTSAPDVGNGTGAWTVSFTDGTLGNMEVGANAGSVRCVR